MGRRNEHHWLVWWVRTFVLVNDKSVVADFGKNMKPLQKKYVGDWYAETRDYYLQPLQQIHLQSAEIDGSFDTDIQHDADLYFLFCRLIDTCNFLHQLY